jgi:HEAT repeat protein
VWGKWWEMEPLRRPSFFIDAIGPRLSNLDGRQRPALIDALKTRQRYREQVVELLASFGPAARAALPVLLTLFDRNQARAEVLRSLVQIDPEAERTQTALIAGLRDEDYLVRMAALELSKKFGPKARAAVPALLELLKDEENEWARGQVGNALKKIDPEPYQRAGLP